MKRERKKERTRKNRHQHSVPCLSTMQNQVFDKDCISFWGSHHKPLQLCQLAVVTAELSCMLIKVFQYLYVYSEKKSWNDSTSKLWSSDLIFQNLCTSMWFLNTSKVFQKLTSYLCTSKHANTNIHKTSNMQSPKQNN